MKKVLLGLGLLAALAVRGECATTTQYHAIGAVQMSSATMSGSMIFWSLPIATINAITPSTTGQMVLCNNCTQSSICISSGSTAPGAWVVAVDTGVHVGTTWSGFTHCQ